VGLVNKSGEFKGIVKKRYEPPYFTDHKGEAEQDPDYYYACIVDVIKRLKKESGAFFPNIIGMTLDTVRDTSVILDENFKPLHRTILWLDQRLASGSLAHRPKLHSLIFNLVGMMPTMRLNARKSICLWYQENLPDIWKKTRHYGNISSYLTYKMTGEWKDSPASIIGHYPLDFKKGKYLTSHRALKNLYDIPISYLPELVPQGEILGHISDEFKNATGLPSNLPLYSCGSDKACESLGVGALDSRIAALSYGTASTVEVTTKKYYESQPFLPSYPFCIYGYHNMDIQIYRGYWMINWFLQYFCHFDISNNEEFVKIIKEFNKKMLTIPPGSNGLILQPYWQPGLARPLAKGAVIGFTDTHTSAHFYRAIIEGVGYALREGMEYFQHKNGHRVEEIMISGGGSQSDEICQVTSDLFGLPVSRVQTFETSLLGAGIAGFLAAKEFASPEEAIKAMVHKSKTFTPNMEDHKAYNKIFYRGYKKMYSKLSRIYKDIR
ncbi:MAG: FGGY-family carbohydrate kinase, partial [Bacilli bacterium]|nr:FGGY-family carbohydrate kinase [Bacilli bacterium]